MGQYVERPIPVTAHKILKVERYRSAGMGGSVDIIQCEGLDEMAANGIEHYPGLVVEPQEIDGYLVYTPENLGGYHYYGKREFEQRFMEQN